MKDVPSQLVNCFSKKDYLSATKMLVSSINTGENALKDVVGLQELKSELQLKKQVNYIEIAWNCSLIKPSQIISLAGFSLINLFIKLWASDLLFRLQELYTKVVAEVKEQIYVRSPQEIVALTRQGSARDSTDQSSPSALGSDKKTPSKRSQFRLEVPGSAKYVNFWYLDLLSLLQKSIIFYLYNSLVLQIFTNFLFFSCLISNNFISLDFCAISWVPILCTSLRIEYILLEIWFLLNSNLF